MKQVTRGKKKTYSQPIVETVMTSVDVIMVSAIMDNWNDFQGNGELY